MKQKVCLRPMNGLSSKFKALKYVTSNLLRPIVLAETAGKPPKTITPPNQKKWFVGKNIAIGA